MKTKMLLCLFIGLLMPGFANPAIAQVPASQDTVVIPGDIPAHQDTIIIPGDLPDAVTFLRNGTLETIINGDTLPNGSRVNPYRVYALQEGYYYYQNAPININNPTGTLTIVGIPSVQGTTKPVWLMNPVNNTPILINGGGCNVVYGSLKFENIHYQAMQTDGTLNNENFYCGTKNQLPQSLTINNCLFEFANIDLFDCTNESGAIGGWPNGAKFRITNSYFRNLFHANQWWGSRIFQCKHPIDTLWVENVTITGGGLTFLQQNELTDFGYFVHNTIVNNHKYWLTSPYYHTLIMANNIFMNENWVGEDSNEISSGTNPDRYYMSTINIDTINSSNKVVVQQKYYASADSTSYSSALALPNLQIFITNNVNYNNPLLNSYFTNAGKFYDTSNGYLLSYLGWYFPSPQRINNMPGEWMNARTKALFDAYSPANGCGFVEENTTTANPFIYTADQIDSATVRIMGEWNQNMYMDPKWPTAPDVYHSKMIFGDYDPATIPGGGTETGGGITNFTDLPETFAGPGVYSTIDGLPVGALIWNPTQLVTYNSAVEFACVRAAYLAIIGVPISVHQGQAGVAKSFHLNQNFPNPFNPSTVISYQLPSSSLVTLKIYDILGREIVVLVDEKENAGNYSVTFNAVNLPSGVYFYKLAANTISAGQAGSFTQTKRLVLLK